VHAEGEQGTCYLGSVFDVPGASMRDKLRHINEVDD
jgi:proline racemase